MAKIISYNVNGIRAAMNKDWTGWVKSVNPDLICLQEIKAQQDQLDMDAFASLGYKTYWNPAVKKGYSGVALFSKNEPDNVVLGCGIEKYDNEGRIIRADYGDFTILSCYFPSGSSGEERQAFKMDFLEDFTQFIQELKRERPNLLISGDVNICHEAIDIHNPVSNKNSSGFLPEERDWMSSFLSEGFVDSFRHLNKDPHNYTWWSYRFNARKKNLGWRIDYHLITESLLPQLQDVSIHADAIHSDHCPIEIQLDLKI